MKRATGRISRILRASACGAMALALGVMGASSAQAGRVSGVKVSTHKANVRLQAGVNARSYKSMTKRGWRYQARVWYHKGKSWRLLYKLPLKRPSLSMRYAKSRLCRGHKGRVVVQMAIGRQLRGSWWNSSTRKYQKSFYPYRSQMHVVKCNRVLKRTTRGLRAKPKAAKMRGVRGVRRRVRPAPRAAGRYGNAWRKAGRYGNAWRGIGQFKARYGNAWRTAGKKKKGRYGNAWRRR